MTHLVLTDIDEVLLDWGGHFEAWYNRTVGSFGGATPAKRLAQCSNIEEWLNCDLATTRKLIEQFNQCKDHFPFITAYEDAQKYVKLLHSEGYSFIAITACTDDTWTHDVRRSNLEDYFPGVFNTIHCVGLGGSKRKVLEMYRPTWWIDDKPKHAEDGGQLGHKAFLMTQHNNTHAILTHSKRAKNWQEIYECINDDDCYRPGWMA